MKYRDVVKIIEAEGWYLKRTKGSHMIFWHTSRSGVVTIPGGGKLNREIKPGTLASVLKQAGVRRKGD